jgi:aminoglycoside phosphotransferase (APT) family kinase protein
VLSVDMPTGTKEVDERYRFDSTRLEELLRREIEEFEGGLQVRQFRGGQSNPTYELSDGSQRWVLRRKPPGVLLPSAHAVDREFRVISALHAAGFLVPRARLFCGDESVIGTMFFVMDHVDGRVLWDPSLAEMARDDRAALYDSIIDTLAGLHSIDYEAIGLADYGRPGNYFARQASRWTRQYRASETGTIPEMETLIDWLPANIPDDAATSLVHGDYGLNNLLVHPTQPRLVAVLDWELSTIGHPLGDLTYLLSQRRMESNALFGLDDATLRERGIPTEAEFVAAYCDRMGRDGVENLDFYLAFHLFRSASIMQGIAGRVKQGTAAGERAESVGELVQPLAAKGLELARRLGA